MTTSTTFRWLHFSDIHVGVGGQDRVWPRAETILLDDLETAYRRTGGFDCVVFSGDLAQKGDPIEFDKFDEIIGRILRRLEKFGPTPPIITVPGNHDLSRPESVDPVAIAFSQFWSQRSLRDRVWENDERFYRPFLTKVFQNYSTWRDRAIKRGIHLQPIAEGLLPGDASYAIDTALGRVGFIGLNSTWLQLGGGDYLGQLHVDARQLLAVTGGKPDDWVRQNEVNLLVTHHPATWLHADSPASWDNDINPAGRFDLHLFGHMHKPDITSTSHGGGLARRHVQAASLFGLETYGDGHDRIQGYSANLIAIDGVNRVLTNWPRRLIELASGQMKLAPDNTQDISEETGSLNLPYRVERSTDARVTLPAAPQPSTPNVRLVPAVFDLSAVRHPMAGSKAHQKVRRVEQQACMAALEAGRTAWLVSDWGMGEDGFIAAVCNRIGIVRENVFGIDFNGFANSTAFFDMLRTRLGTTFQQICDAVAEVGPCILILDDVDITSSPATIEAAIDALIKPVCDFAPSARIIIRSRRRPKNSPFPVIELRALDEPDIAIYARESELGGDRYAKPDAVSSLFRHTDGVPSRIDDTLRDLEIVSLADLITANPDYGDAAAAVSSAPAALVATVSELARSENRAEERAYNLLLALSALPQGEQLTRLTRFLGPHPFHASHARTLLERSLIDTATITTLEGMPGDSTKKVLVAPRSVREYVRSVMDDETVRSFDRKALELYFGDNWASGDIAQSPTGKRVRRALCDGYEIQNASALILRSTRRGLLDDIDLEVGGLTRLALAFVNILIVGDHFRSALALCEDLIRLLEEFGKHGREVNFLRSELARSFRMTGNHSAAEATFKLLDHSMLSKDQRQRAELGLALVLKQMGDRSSAVGAARRAIAIDKRSRSALQAKTILAEDIDDKEERAARLRKLLIAARRDQSTTVKNNILLTLADLEKDEVTATRMLKEVMQSPPGEDDFYNNVRAVVDFSSRFAGTPKFSEADRSRLIGAYHFLYSERLIGLFDRCHDALWLEFERSGETTNLLNLFRHSSFIWRLSGREAMELRYLAKLISTAKQLVASDPIKTPREVAYLVTRISVVLKELDLSSKA